MWRWCSIGSPPKCARNRTESVISASRSFFIGATNSKSGVSDVYFVSPTISNRARNCYHGDYPPCSVLSQLTDYPSADAGVGPGTFRSQALPVAPANECATAPASRT